jgi:hypothetical protein
MPVSHPLLSFLPRIAFQTTCEGKACFTLVYQEIEKGREKRAEMKKGQQMLAFSTHQVSGDALLFT